MKRRFGSGSGDLLADRRFALAEALGADGDHAAAADLLAQTVERVPDWAPAWLALGLALERSGSIGEAVEACRRADALDPDGALGANLHVARLSGGKSPESMPPAFVRTLFDQYADRFDAHLVRDLDYSGPARLVEALERVGCPTARDALDLGCGTGLMAAALAAFTTAVDGVDLSPAMVEKAALTGRYRKLSVGDLDGHLAACPVASYDLVVAADVLVYLGALEATFAAVARVLRRDGLFAFTLQSRSTDSPYTLGSDMRFSHHRSYAEAALAHAGLSVAVAEATSTRTEGGVPVPGLVVVARRA